MCDPYPSSNVSWLHQHLLGFMIPIPCWNGVLHLAEYNYKHNYDPDPGQNDVA